VLPGPGFYYFVFDLNASFLLRRDLPSIRNPRGRRHKLINPERNRSAFLGRYCICCVWAFFALPDLEPDLLVFVERCVAGQLV